MMVDRLLALGLKFLHQIVQKKVDQYSVDLDLGMVPFDLSPDEFHAPYTAGFTVCQLNQSQPRKAHKHANLPLSCISQVLPLGMTSFSLIADPRGGLYDKHPMVLRICGTR